MGIGNNRYLVKLAIAASCAIRPEFAPPGAKSVSQIRVELMQEHQATQLSATLSTFLALQ